MPDIERPHGRDLRKGRYSEAGYIYHLTTVTRDRVRVFADFAAARVLINAMKAAQFRGQAETLAFVVMPDHWHWLMQLGKSDALSRAMGSVKSVVAHRLGGKIWQPGFHDHAVRQDADLQALARYIIANPVRAGLVESVREYSHWDAMWL